MSAVPTTEIMTPVERFGALLRASQAISSTGDRNHRVDSFARELHSVVDFDYLFVGKCIENAREAKCVLEANGRRFELAEIEMPIAESTSRWAHENQQVLTIADWAQEQRFPKMQEFLAGLGIASTCALPLNRRRSPDWSSRIRQLSSECIYPGRRSVSIDRGGSDRSRDRRRRQFHVIRDCRKQAETPA